MRDTDGSAGDGSRLGHAGELELRAMYPGSYRWDARSIGAMMRPTISPALARFIEALPFFFIGTADADGMCDCSFRGREHRSDGTPLPALKVMNDRQLAFPDFPGNGLYNSLGNIRVNPGIGMLFMDFERQRRARVNGRATIRPVDGAARMIWPTAQAVVTVEVAQAYGNCSARIPRLAVVAGSDAEW